ncbi:hypothetical protein [Bartonella sp. WD16.2]|uniref:hypothetical protein n=1 Tax=Bartonella sp. WD16.2 TaxID=1933904 RepID=UPI00099A2703|nr:hypothetical protein [Bartonella sp. WD16.2]AQX19992.1 hypothetical protein BWD162_008800 [Bartonella sp. WD16.2]
MPIQGIQHSASGLRASRSGLDFNNVLSEPEPRYMYVKDRNAPHGIRAVPIPGSAAERKLIREEQANKLAEKKDNYILKIIGPIEQKSSLKWQRN